jgi:hypothetical protein
MPQPLAAGFNFNVEEWFEGDSRFPERQFHQGTSPYLPYQVGRIIQPCVHTKHPLQRVLTMCSFSFSLFSLPLRQWRFLLL